MAKPAGGPAPKARAPFKKRTFQDHRAKDGNSVHAPVAKKGLPVKQQIRNVKRLLAREGIPEDMRRNQETKLAQLEKELEAHELKMRAREYKKRYRRVRHVETVKLQRRLAQARRALHDAATEEERAAAGERVRLALLDLEYVEHFPPAEKYISILVEPEDPEQREHVLAERVRLRALAAARAAEAALLTEAHEGRPTLARAAAAAPPPPQGAAEEDDFFLLSEPSSEAEGGDGTRDDRATTRSRASHERRAPAPPAPKPRPAAERQAERPAQPQLRIKPPRPPKRAPEPPAAQPQRTRAEGGRKRRKRADA